MGSEEGGSTRATAKLRRWFAFIVRGSRGPITSRGGSWVLREIYWASRLGVRMTHRVNFAHEIERRCVKYFNLSSVI